MVVVLCGTGAVLLRLAGRDAETGGAGLAAARSAYVGESGSLKSMPFGSGPTADEAVGEGALGAAAASTPSSRMALVVVLMCPCSDLLTAIACDEIPVSCGTAPRDTMASSACCCSDGGSVVRMLETREKAAPSTP